MNRPLGILSLAFCLLPAFEAVVQASELEIVGFDASRGMQFEGGTIGNYFTLEFAPTLDGPWTNWGSVSSASITGTVMSLPIPFFYRIVESPAGAFSPYATGTPVYVESDADALQAVADLESSLAATYQPTGNYATGTPLYVETDAAALAQGFATTSAVNDALAGYVATQHVGNVGIIGRLGIGTNAVAVTIPPRTNFSVGLQMVNSGLLIESKDRPLQSPALAGPAYIALGYDAREFGRASLWLNSYDYMVNGTNYDASSDIYFGTGTNMTDATLRWSICSRPTNQGWGHDSDGQLAIFEGNGAGETNISGVRRFAIFPDKGGRSGPIVMGYDDRYPNPYPNTNDTLNVVDYSRSPQFHLEGRTNAATSQRPRIKLSAGGNEAALTMIGSNGNFAVALNGTDYLGITATGGVWVSSLALGTNAAVSDWPRQGIETELDLIALQALAVYGSAAETLYQPAGAYATGMPLYVETDAAALAQGFATTSAVNAALEGYLTSYSETGGLASVAARGGLAGSEILAPLAVNAQQFGQDAGMNSTGTNWFAAGREAGKDVTGNKWTAVGLFAGLRATGDQFVAVGPAAGRDAAGNDWVAAGHGAGEFSQGDLWTAVGSAAGYGTRGSGYSAYGYYAGYESEGFGWTAIGRESGMHSSGTNWIAVGKNAGNKAFGARWEAFGDFSGYESTGDYWLAIGLQAGRGAVWSNSAAFGPWAGRSATGTNRLYMDVYDFDGDPGVNGGTNDAIFIDDGNANLGRSGLLADGKTNHLRGEWTVSSLALGTNAAVSDWPRSGIEEESDPLALGALAALPTNDWTKAHAWGDHAAAGYLTAEEDATGLAAAAAAQSNLTIHSESQDAHGLPDLRAGLAADGAAIASNSTAIAAVGATASNALPASATNGWEVGSHAGLATGTPIYVETHAAAGYLTAEEDVAGLAAAAAAQSDLAAHAESQDAHGLPEIRAGLAADGAAIASNSTAIVAVGAAASNALPASATNGWEVGSHAGLLTAEQDLAALDALAALPTNAWNAAYAWGDHATAGYLTNNGTANALAARNLTATKLWIADPAQGGTNGVVGMEYDSSDDGWTVAGRSSFEGAMAKWDQSVSTQHVGNIGLKGRLALGTNVAKALMPSATNTYTNAEIALHAVDGGILLESKNPLPAPYAETPAYIHLGYDARAALGRASLWLNSYGYELYGTRYDASADIYFGVGTNMTDETMRWSLCSRPTNGYSTHDNDGQLAVFEGAKAGLPGQGGRRFAIFPGTGNGKSGPIVLGNDDRYPNPYPNTNDTLNVVDYSRHPQFHLEGRTNATTTSRPRIKLSAAGNEAAITFIGTNRNLTVSLNGTNRLGITATGGVWMGQIALGTNAAVSNWPAGGGGTVTGLTFNGVAADVSGGNAVLSYPPPSRIVAENYVVQARDYAIGADTAADDVEVTLPDMGTNFTSVFIRKFSGANELAIRRGMDVLDILHGDGDGRAYDWWPTRTNWYRRN